MSGKDSSSAGNTTGTSLHSEHCMHHHCIFDTACKHCTHNTHRGVLSLLSPDAKLALLTNKEILATSTVFFINTTIIQVIAVTHKKRGQSRVLYTQLTRSWPVKHIYITRIVCICQAEYMTK